MGNVFMKLSSLRVYFYLERVNNYICSWKFPQLLAICHDEVRLIVLAFQKMNLW
jgi:hypothetical protein